MVRSDGYVKLVDFGLARVGITPDGETVVGGHHQGRQLDRHHRLLFSGAGPRRVAGMGHRYFFLWHRACTRPRPACTPFRRVRRSARRPEFFRRNPIPPTQDQSRVAGDAGTASALHAAEGLRGFAPPRAKLSRSWTALRKPASDIDAVFLKTPDRHTVGRGQQLQELHAALNLAAAGRGSLVCVSGEAGIGKSTLVEEFLATLQSQRTSLQCCPRPLLGTSGGRRSLFAHPGSVRQPAAFRQRRFRQPHHADPGAELVSGTGPGTTARLFHDSARRLQSDFSGTIEARILRLSCKKFAGIVHCCFFLKMSTGPILPPLTCWPMLPRALSRCPC